MSNIRIHPEDWNALTGEEKDQVLGILANNGFVPTHKVEISGDAERILPPESELQAMRAEAGKECRKSC